MSSQGCPEIGKLHKCKLKPCLTSCAHWARWSFLFLFMFPSSSQNHHHIFVNYISIKMTLRYRYNNTLFIILFQQRKAYFLLTATHSTWRVRKREREKKPALKDFTEEEERHFFQCCRKKKKIQLFNQAIIGRTRPEPRHCYSSSSLAATKSNKTSFTGNFATQT